MSPDEIEEHRASVEEWREARYASLRRPVGWLSLAGLGWLRPGENRIGVDPANEVTLPSGPAVAGRLRLIDGRVTAQAEPGSGLEHVGAETDRSPAEGSRADGSPADGSPAERHPVDGLPMVADVDAPDREGPTMLALGPLRMCLIRRGERLALRVWDTEAPALRDFDGIPHYPVDPTWRLLARFERVDPPRSVEVPDVLGSTSREPSPGIIQVEHDRAVHELGALEGGPDGELWLVFGDATNGDETYGGGRYLYTPPPMPDGTVVVDFNRAYNPPCVFTPYATCPLPWPGNRLPFRVEAGERRVDAH